jgi:hypothetical protein
MTEHDPIPAAAWTLLDLLLTRLYDGTLTPAEIPAPVTRHEQSAALDLLEGELFPADGEARHSVAVEHAAVRLARRFVRDDPEELCRLLNRLKPDAATGHRVRAFLDALSPTAPSGGAVH